MSRFAPILVGLLAAYFAASPVVAESPYKFSPSRKPRPRKLEFGTALSRLRFRSAVETKDMFRAAGQPNGKTTESKTDRRFQASVWEVPGGSGILRVESSPLSMKTAIGDHETRVNLGDLPVSVRYIKLRGMPSTYWGEEIPDQKSTSLVFPEQEVGPGDKWERFVPANKNFELPTEVSFRYLREGRVANRLVLRLK